MQIKHFLQFNDFSREEYEYLFERARWIKQEFKQYRRYWPLEDRTLAMIFDKHSTRTRLAEASLSRTPRASCRAWWTSS
jgi:ornithine carbamoyltransferase